MIIDTRERLRQKAADATITVVMQGNNYYGSSVQEVSCKYNSSSTRSDRVPLPTGIASGRCLFEDRKSGKSCFGFVPNKCPFLKSGPFLVVSRITKEIPEEIIKSPRFDTSSAEHSLFSPYA